MARRVRKKGKNKNRKSENIKERYVLNIQKTVIIVRKKQCNVNSRMNYLQFGFKGPKYFRNLVFTQPTFTFSKLTIEILEQGMKYVQSLQ